MNALKLSKLNFLLFSKYQTSSASWKFSINQLKQSIQLQTISCPTFLTIHLNSIAMKNLAPSPLRGRAFSSWGTLPQPFPLGIDPQPSPIVRLIAEALGLCGKVHGGVSGDTALMHHDGHSFLESFDVRDKGWICDRGWAHDIPSQSGRRMPSTISRFWASLMPPD
jgi:hypothetical protein